MTIRYIYDANGIQGFYTHEGTATTRYYYVKNVLGDIIGITNDDGVLVAQYTYNAYGKIMSILDGNGNDVSTNYTHIANVNPFRYKGYYYDVETGFYYLQSRYYDPETGRFINADSQLNQDDVLGYNVFAYCYNNPITFSDADGYKPKYFASEEDALLDFAENYYTPNENPLYSTSFEYMCIIEKVEIECVSHCYAMVEKSFLWWTWREVEYSKTVYKQKAYVYSVIKGSEHGVDRQPYLEKYPDMVAMGHTHPNYPSFYKPLCASDPDYNEFMYIDSVFGRKMNYYICIASGNTLQYSAGIKDPIFILPETHSVHPVYAKIGGF